MRPLPLGLALLLAGPAAAAGPDTPAAAYARETQLKARVSVAQKGLPLIDFLKELAAEVEKRQVKTPKWTYAADVPKSLPVTYSCKDKPLEDVLAEVFKAPGLGYVVVSQEDDKYDGFLRVVKGPERGYAKGAGPAAGGGDDKPAAARLAAAKELIAEGKALQAKAVLKALVKTYPDAPAAKDAARLLEALDK